MTRIAFKDEYLEQAEARTAEECALKFKETGRWILGHLVFCSVVRLVEQKRFDLLDKLIERGVIDKTLVAEAERYNAKLEALNMSSWHFDEGIRKETDQ